jgi:hypothetical protein
MERAGASSAIGYDAGEPRLLKWRRFEVLVHEGRGRECLAIPSLEKEARAVHGIEAG